MRAQLKRGVAMPEDTNRKGKRVGDVTFMLIPHSTEKPRSFRAPGSALKVASIVSLVLLVFCAYFVGHYTSLMSSNHALRTENEQLIAERDEQDQLHKEKLAKIENLQEHIASQDEQIDLFAEQTEMFEEKMDILMEREEAIIDAANIDQSRLPSLPDLEDEAVLSESSDAEPEFRALSYQGNDLTGTEQTIRLLNAAAPSQLKRLEEIENQVEQQKIEEERRRRHTPSIWPTSGRVSSPFGNRRSPTSNRIEFHSGIDIATGHGTPVRAGASGRVVFRGYRGSFGNLIIIDHGYSFSTYYAHLSRFNVSHGQSVTKGDVIGYVGQTGRATGPHLHYEVHVNGSPVNPRNYMP